MKSRDVGTIVLGAGPADPVVNIAFMLFSDPANARCTFKGTAIPAA